MTGHSSYTLTNFVQYYHQLIASTFNAEENMLGCDGIIVEIDESKMEKIKYRRGHRVEGAWVFGGIEKTIEKKIFLAHVPNHSAEMLLSVLKNHVLSGSILYSDMWKAYENIEIHLRFEHYTVNYSTFFKGCIIDVHTNTIESLWNEVKLRIAPQNRNKMSIYNHLMEYIWRRQNKDRLWDALLDTFTNTYYA